MAFESEQLYEFFYIDTRGVEVEVQRKRCKRPTATAIYKDLKQSFMLRIGEMRGWGYKIVTP